MSAMRLDRKIEPPPAKKTPRRRRKGYARASDETFHRRATKVLGRLQTALYELIESTPGHTRRAAELARTLRIPPKLAWQVHKVAHADDPLAVAGHVPSPATMERFLAAAEQRGASSERVDAASDAMAAFEAMVSDHAGGRSKFDSIISGLALKGSDHVDLRHKRAAFRAQSHLLGVQAETQLACYIYRASNSDPKMIDAVGLRGLIGLQRFRANASWLVSSMGVLDDEGNEREEYVPAPLAPQPEGGDEIAVLGLLPEFCSKPLPRLKRYESPTGNNVNFELEPDGVGAKAAVTCLVGHAFPNSFARYCDDHNSVQASRISVHTPCKVLILDTLVQRGLFAPTPPDVASYSNHRGNEEVQNRDREWDRLALNDSVVYLGRGSSVLETPELPRYEELAQYAFDRVGWDGEEFDVYRCRVEFPVLPSSVVVRFNLREKPE